MNEFKIGQRVRVTGKGAIPAHKLAIGELGVVVAYGGSKGGSYDIKVERPQHPAGSLSQYVHSSELVYEPREGDRVLVKDDAMRHFAGGGENDLVYSGYAGPGVVSRDGLDSDGDVVIHPGTSADGIMWARPEDVTYLGPEEPEPEPEPLAEWEREILAPVGDDDDKPERELRVGDRVRVVNPGANPVERGDVGTVAWFDGSLVRVNFDGEKVVGLFSKRLEPVQPGSEEQGIRPNYYGGTDNPYEAIKVIEAWGLNFSLGSVVKYVARTGKKDPATAVEDLQKAATYLQLEIDRLNNERAQES